jgi:hypothetical protein
VDLVAWALQMLCNPLVAPLALALLLLVLARVAQPQVNLPRQLQTLQGVPLARDRLQWQLCRELPAAQRLEG